MSNHLFKYIPFSVAQLTSAIDQGTLALPDIQRPFVWPNTKVRDLLDSMYRGFPVGQVMFWQTGASPGAKQIGTDSKPVAVPYHLIVDGQQRLTSLYAVVTGKPVVRSDFTTARIKIAFNPFSEQFSVQDATTLKQVEWLADITPLFDDFLETVETFIDRLEQARGDLSRTERKHLFAVFDRVRDLIGYSFSVVELDAAADEEQVAEVFVRINSEGVTLNQADFILTLMSVFWESGRQGLEDFARAAKTPSLSHASPFNWYIQPQPAQMLRVSAALAFRRAVLKLVYTVLRGKDLETGKADPERRQTQFRRFEQAQAKALDLTNWHEFLQCLERAGFRGSKMISSENAVLYTYAMWLIGRVDFNVPLDRLREVMARWFFMASITARYSGSFESQVEKDLAVLKGLPTGTPDAFCEALDRVVKDTLTSDFWTITLPNDLATSATKSPALNAYIAALNILDADALLSTGKVRSRLDPAITAKKGIERHHLFPREYLRKKLGITDVKSINQIANMALVEWSDNIKISDQPPAEYWPQQVAAKQPHGLDADRLARQVEWHALPDGWQDMVYREFLVQRRTLMASVVRKAFALLADESYAPTYPQPAPEELPQQPVLPLNVNGSLRDLLTADLLSPGTILTAVDDNEVTAEITLGGLISFDGVEYETPSAAARAANDSPTSGWNYWVADTPEGPRLLAEVLDLMRGSEEPPAA